MSRHRAMFIVHFSIEIHLRTQILLPSNRWYKLSDYGSFLEYARDGIDWFKIFTWLSQWVASNNSEWNSLLKGFRMFFTDQACQCGQIVGSPDRFAFLKHRLPKYIPADISCLHNWPHSPAGTKESIQESRRSSSGVWQLASTVSPLDLWKFTLSIKRLV